MKLLAMNIIEHPDLAADEAWIVFDENATQVPAFNIIRTRKGLWLKIV